MVPGSNSEFTRSEIIIQCIEPFGDPVGTIGRSSDGPKSRETGKRYSILAMTALGRDRPFIPRLLLQCFTMVKIDDASGWLIQPSTGAERPKGARIDTRCNIKTILGNVNSEYKFPYGKYHSIYKFVYYNRNK